MASKKKPAKKPAAKKAASKASPSMASASKASASKASTKEAAAPDVVEVTSPVERPPNPNPGYECLDINRKALIQFIVVTLAVVIATFFGMIPVLAKLTGAEMKKGDSPFIALKNADKPKSYNDRLNQYEALGKQQGSYNGRDRLQVDPPREIIELVEKQSHVLNSYGYDPETQKARIPIELAMEKMLSQGVKTGKPKEMVMTPELELGKAIYLGKGACFSCHGNTGHGDGPAAIALNPKPRSFVAGDFLYDTDGDGTKGSAADMKNIMQNGTIKYGGSPLMPARPDIAGEELENLVKFLQAMKAE